MNKISEYDVKDPLFDEKHGVLKNKLSIKDSEKLETIEIKHLLKAYEKAALEYSENHKFTEKDICYIHKLFFGDIYKWAGKYRNIDISSEKMRYCHAVYIPQNMKTFSNELYQLTPFKPELPRQEILQRLAKIHGDLIIIHPFRDGNGRTTRLLCDLLLMQAEYKALDTTIFYDKSFIKKYHQAIQNLWHTKNTSLLVQIFNSLLLK
jgi:cell filamentation protein